MDKHTKIAGAAILFSAMIIIAAPLNALMGAVAGWTVGLFWGDTIISVLRSLGIPEKFTMWQIGATLGFLGSFLRTKIENH